MRTPAPFCPRPLTLDPEARFLDPVLRGLSVAELSRFVVVVVVVCLEHSAALDSSEEFMLDFSPVTSTFDLGSES